MGCGKSSLAKKISNKTGYKLIDTDKEIENITGETIPNIFHQKGEAYFRELEKDFIQSLTPNSKLIISTGGGLPCFNDNMFRLNNLGLTFYLKLSPFELSKRLKDAKQVRPLLLNKSDEELLIYVTELLSLREIFYNQANFTLKGKEQKPDFILDLVSIN